MSEFHAALREELGTDRYVGACLQSIDEAVFVVDIDDSATTVSLLVKDYALNEGSYWQCVLTNEKITSHMEDDVGIFDTSGLRTFASYFSDAILENVMIDRSVSTIYPRNAYSNTIALKLTYQIGHMTLEGLLKLDSVQKGLNVGIVDMMCRVKDIDFKQQVTKASKAARPKIVPPSIQFKNSSAAPGGEIGTVAVQGTEEKDEDEHQPVKAKKRKIGGVAIFPGKKK